MLFLSGGGNWEESFKLDDIFFNALAKPKILYIPIGLVRGFGGYEGCYQWFTDTLARHQMSSIQVDMWINLKSGLEEDLTEYGGVYIGGASNTRRLLGLLYENNTTSGLTHFEQGGGLLYGGSSGADIMGLYIDYTRDRELRHKYEKRSYPGLDLMRSCSVFTHYRKTEEDIYNLSLKSEKLGITIIAMTEEDMLVRTVDGEVKIVNDETLHVFQKGRMIEYSGRSSFAIEKIV